MNEATVHEPYRSRLEACRAALRDRNAGAVVCAPGPNMTYLSGFAEEPSERHLLLFVSRNEALFVVPELYDEQLAAESSIAERRTWADGDDPTALVRTVAADLELEGEEVLLDDRMWERFSRDIRAAIPDATFGLGSEVLADLRVRKDAHELQRLREAARIADTVSVAVRELGDEAIGRTERDLAREIERRLVDAGGEGVPFDTVVGSGPNGARPHHRYGDREIESGEPVVLDFGTTVEGYPSDQTRTVVFDGAPPERFQAAYETVREAQRAAVEAVSPGVEAGTVDRAARAVVEDRGFGDAFVHRTGHGVGLEVHEPPYIVEGNGRRLEPGMVFSVEPGVYLQGEFGVRIEDLVVVTEDGAERLNGSPRTWEALSK